MKMHEQAIDALRRLAAQLEGHDVAMLTAMESPGRLASRPMTPIEMDGDGAIWFMAARASTQPSLGGVPKAVNLAFVRPQDSDYVSVSGTAELVEDASRKEALWNVFARPWFTGPQDPELTLIRVRPDHAEIWDGPDNAVGRVLAMAASVIAGREIGLGKKETVDTLVMP